MSVTVEELLTEKFKNFYAEIYEYLPDFNKPEDANVLEILELFLFLFPDDNTEFNIRQVLELKGSQMTDQNIEKVVPIIDKHLKILRKIKTVI